MFLCAADAEQSLTRGLQVPNADDMRAEVLERLANMNVTAATLFPDLAGLARSLRTLPIRAASVAVASPPWGSGATI